VAGAVDASFSTNANLEVFQLDLAKAYSNSDGGDNGLVKSVVSVPTAAPFHQLAWGAKGAFFFCCCT